MWVVNLVQDGVAAVARRVPLGTFRIGRDPASDLVLDDPLTSWAHTALFNEGPRLFVEDTRSTNGTFVDGEVVQGRVELYGEEILRVGETRLHIVWSAGPAERPWLLVDVTSGARLPLDQDVRVGGDEDDDLRIPGVAPSALLFVRRSGQIFLAGRVEPVEDGDVFALGERLVRIERADPTRVATLPLPQVSWPYEVTARRNGPRGPCATIEAPHGLRYEVVSGHCAVLLYLLVRGFVADPNASPQDRGWCDDGEVHRGIWGRGGDGRNRLDVLLYRLRRGLERAGLDPWFLQKRHRQVRICPRAARIEDEVVESDPTS